VYYSGCIPQTEWLTLTSKRFYEAKRGRGGPNHPTKVGGDSMGGGRVCRFTWAMPFRFPPDARHLLFAVLLSGLCLNGWAVPAAKAPVLRVLAPHWLELEQEQLRLPDGFGTAQPWNLLIPAGSVPVPQAGQFTVTVAGRPVAVRTVGFKRRAVSAPLDRRELRVGAWVYLELAEPVPPDAEVRVANPDRSVWATDREITARAEPLRTSPAIHVNQEGYLPAGPKQAMIGHYLGSAGELPVTAGEFQIVAADGRAVFSGRLRPRPDEGYTYSPTPYQQVFEADFSALRTPGRYRLVVPGLGASLPFRVDEGVALGLARTYALGIYHQRCGGENALPFTRFTHAACHTAPATVPSPQEDYPFTWKTIARLSAEGEALPAGSAPVLSGEAAQLYPFVRKGPVDVAGGHHDAGDYSKYTSNSALFIHALLFAVDALPGVAALDNLGLPESGDGISDVLQEAKWEVDFLAKLQDDDGGFYFLVYPRDRPYENNVLPDRGDPQVVWPKNTAVTAAAVAALAQAAGSPHFRRAFPAAASDCRARAERGWRFIEAAIARHGRAGIYQRLTHYGDNHRDRDELAWAACELFLATGDRAYHDKFREWCDPADAATRRWGWWRLNEGWGNAIRSYAFGARTGRVQAAQLDRALLAKCEQEVELAGRDALRWSDHSAYGTSFPDETKRMRAAGWYFSLDQAFDLAAASQLDYPRGNDPRPAFLRAFVANLNYELGTNPVNLSYLTGAGQRRQREVVHQFAHNDRRVLPPSGLPIGNIQTGQPWLDHYKAELGALSFPEDGAPEGLYPFYDRWTDTHNPAAEFVIVNQARALAGVAWLAASTGLARQPWQSAAGTITGLPKKLKVGDPVSVRLEIPRGLDPAQAEIMWEAAGQEPAQGPAFAFTPTGHGRQWIEAEARWPDGRRVFASADFNADNGRPNVTVRATQAEASVAAGQPVVLVFSRTGERSAPLAVKFDLRGNATKWNDYRRPEGDMPVEVVIPAGKESVEMKLVPVAAGLGANARHLVLEIVPDGAYNRAAPHAVVATFAGKDAAPAPPAPKLPELDQ
jgi:hypothetical protein